MLWEPKKQGHIFFLSISFQTTILPLSLPVYDSLCFSANSLGGSDTPWLDQLWDQLHGQNSSRKHLHQHHSYLSSHSGPSPSSLPLLCSTSGLPLHRCPLFTKSGCLFFSPLSFSLSLSLSHSSPLPPPPVLCVRVCRWPSLAGSVTRGNWGRVHFHRTNGNKLICFHCCVFETVFWSWG